MQRMQNISKTRASTYER